MIKLLPFKPKHTLGGKYEDYPVWSVAQQKQDNREQPLHPANALSLVRQLHLCGQGQGLKCHYFK